MNDIWHCLLSSICITIPEFIFVVIITLKLMKRNDMLDLYDLKNNSISIILIASPPAIIYDIMRHIIKSSTLINHLLAVIILYFLLIHILKKTLKKRSLDYPKLYSKAFAYLLLSLLLPLVIEMATLPIIFRLLNKTFETISLDFYLILLCSLSSRIIEIIIIIFILIKKNRKFQIKLGDYIFNNKFFMRLIISILIGLIIFEAFFMKYILHNNLLNVFDTIYEQLFVIVCVGFFLPCAIIVAIYSCVNYCVMINNSEKQTFKDD